MKLNQAPYLLKFSLFATSVLAGTFFPLASDACPLGPVHGRYESCINQLLPRPRQDILVQAGPGGLEAHFYSPIEVNHSDISYRITDGVGSFYAEVANNHVVIELPAIYVRDGLRVVQTNEDNVPPVQVSGNDRTAIGVRDFIDEELRDTVIGEAFLRADKDFARFPWGEKPLPEGAPVHPLIEALNVYESNASYRKLAEEWDALPKTAPQIYLSFDPDAPGLVSLEFKPQVLFQSSYGISLEVDVETQAIAELPYQKLKEDVAQRPLAYRQASEELDIAAKTVAVMGILEAACDGPNSCQKLSQQVDAALQEQQAQAQSPYEIWDHEAELSERWEGRKYADFVPGDDYENWQVAYDALQDLVAGNVSYERAESLRIAVQEQFLNYSVPENALLQTGLALVTAWKGDIQGSKQAFDKSFQLSSSNPLDRLEVLKLADEVSSSVEDSDLISEEWETAFRSLKDLVSQLEYYGFTEDLEKDKDFSELKQSVANQFLNNPVPESPLLQVGLALVFALEEDSIQAKETLKKAIQLSSSQPLYQSAIKDIISSDLAWAFEASGDLALSQELYNLSNSLRKEPLIKAYEYVDIYLQSCLEGEGNCSSEELRKWEARAFRLGLTENGLWDWTSEVDIAWLHGRFAYLDGIQLDDPLKQKDRHRYLSHYVQMASGQNLQKLKSFQAELENSWKEKWQLPVVDQSIARASIPLGLWNESPLTAILPGGLLALSVGAVVINKRSKSR